ncbi:hypothetical protein ACQEU3_12230 [Spirillospora sp. CA-253888]
MAEPCRALDFTHEFKALYLEMLYEEIRDKDGKLRGNVDPQLGLLYMVALLHHYNRGRSETFVSRRTIGDDLGIHSNGAPLKAVLDAFLEHGFLVRRGSKHRTDLLTITLPEALRTKYPNLEDAVHGPLLNAPSESPKPEPQQAEVSQATAAAVMEDPFVPEAERWRMQDPFAAE